MTKFESKKMIEEELKDLISKFIEQTKTTEQTTKEYAGEYLNCKLKTSFGAGALARVPWMAFLNYEQKMQEGIYPVLLLDKSKEILYVAYGVSATNNPSVMWDNTILVEKVDIDKYKESFVSAKFTNIYDHIDLDKVVTKLNNVINDFHKKFESIVDLSIISKEHLSKACLEYDLNPNMCNDRKAKNYTLISNSKFYDHKCVVGRAYNIALNREGILESSLYGSICNQNNCASKLLENLGIELFADKKYKTYLEYKYDNKKTINTYYADLRKAIKVLQQIRKFEDKTLSNIFEDVLTNNLTFDEYDDAQKKLGFNDASLFNSLKSKIKAYKESLSFSNKESKNESIKMESNCKIPLNQILYGPPGTGKTYNTINKALEIIEGIVPASRKDAKNMFEEYQSKGQIEFVTFHQSFGYEEFVEGIKAIPVGEIGNDTEEMIYKVVDGVFKKLCESTKTPLKESKLENFNFSTNEIFKMSLGGIYEPEIKEWCLENDYIALGWGGDIDFSEIKRQKNWTLFKKEAYRFLENKDINEESKKFTVQAIYKFKNSMDIGDLVFISNGNSKIASIGQIIGEYEFNDNSEIKYNQFRKVKWLIKDANLPVEKLYDKKLSQQSIYEFYKSSINKEFLLSLFDENTNVEKNYILIIDEINRGNISKIFGELITLIEESKRAGNKEEVKVTLPYSGKPFTVPNNLYILGTMNTADRSIALMDTALRRRFHFEEMMPKTDLLDFEVEGINIRSMLNIINKRIEYLYDRDHMIGHAYFIDLKEKPSLKELENTFRNKVIPLLQEYFYDDWEKIQMILGDHVEQKVEDENKFIVSKKEEEKKLFGFDHDDIEDDQNIFFINKIFTVEAYKKIKL